MIETDDGQRSVAPASFTRGAILASVPFVAILAIISVEHTRDGLHCSEPHREIVDVNVYPWSSIGKVGFAKALMWRRCALVL